MSKSTRYSPEVKERAVRLVFEQEREYSSQWSAIQSIAGKIGCTTDRTYKRPYVSGEIVGQAESPGMPANRGHPAGDAGRTPPLLGM
jgi:transposase